MSDTVQAPAAGPGAGALLRAARENAGVHIASLAGGWTVAVAGFGGMRDHGSLRFAPRLPHRINRLGFRVVYQGRVLQVSMAGTTATYRVVDGEPLDIHHHGRQVTVGDRELELDIPPAPVVEPVHQPLHAAPRRRDRPTSD